MKVLLVLFFFSANKNHKIFEHYLGQLFFANIGARIVTDKIVKSRPVNDENSRNVEKIIITLERREGMLYELRQVL